MDSGARLGNFPEVSIIAMPRANWSSEKLLERLLRNTSERAYRANMHELRSRAEPGLIDLGMTLTSSSIERERMIGVDLLAQLGGSGRPFGKQVLKRYIELLPAEKSLQLQESILHGIGHNNRSLTVAQTSVLQPFSVSPHPDVRRATVQALLGVRNSVAVAILIALSRDKKSDIRDWATFGLGEQIETDAASLRAALWDRVNDRHRNTRAEAINGLAKRGDARIKPIILDALESETAGTLLFDAIAAMHDPDFLQPLKRMYRTYRNDASIDSHWLHKLGQCIRFLSGKPGTEYEP